MYNVMIIVINRIFSTKFTKLKMLDSYIGAICYPRSKYLQSADRKWVEISDYDGKNVIRFVENWLDEMAG